MAWLRASMQTGSKKSNLAGCSVHFGNEGGRKALSLHKAMFFFRTSPHFITRGLVHIWCSIAFWYKHNIITWKQGDKFGQDFLTSKMWSQLRNSTVAIFHPGLRWGLFPCHVSQVAERSSLFRVAFLSAMDAFHGGDGITKVMSGLKRKSPT